MNAGLAKNSAEGTSFPKGKGFDFAKETGEELVQNCFEVAMSELEQKRQLKKRIPLTMRRRVAQEILTQHKWKFLTSSGFNIGSGRVDVIELSVRAPLKARPKNRVESVSWWRTEGQGKTHHLAFAAVFTNFSATVREGKNGGL